MNIPGKRVFWAGLLAFAWLCSLSVAHGQGALSARGLKSTRSSLGKKSVTRAVVVGVSDYQDPDISDLRFAHIDADTFVRFLRSESGGSLQEEQIRLLTNEQATMAGIQSALEWLVRSSDANDRAIIYFSGHGDVETKAEEEKGFLLTHDTPKNNYRLNAIDLDYLNEFIIGELTRKEAKVVVITDACHSGSLAGKNIGGTEVTASELMKRFANEIRIMSCQPYELSLESPKWGNGRGVFSYFLVKGLKGQADDDRDRRVDLYELENYLQQNIRDSTDKAQHPDVFGGRKEEALFLVDEATQAALGVIEKEAIERELEKDILVKLASEDGYQNFTAFNLALAKHRLLFPPGNAAIDYYNALYADTTFISLRGILDERLTIALMDSAQQALNAYLKTDPEELARRDRFDDQYARFPQYLAKAAEILGPRDPRYRPTLAKQFYFEGLVLRMAAEQAGGSDSLFALALAKQELALEQERRAAYIHNELGYLRLELDQPEEGMEALRKAVEISPQWAIPHNNLAVGYKAADSLEQAKFHYQQAVAFKPDFSSAYANLGNLYNVLEQPDSAEICYTIAIDLNPSDPDNYFNLGIFLSRVEGREQDAESAYFRALQQRPDLPEVWNGLGVLYDVMGRPDSAEDAYRKAIALDSAYAEARQNLGIHLYKLERTEEAGQLFLEAFLLDPDLEDLPSQLATVLVERDQWKTATELPLENQSKIAVLQAAGFIYFQSGASGTAIEAFKRAAALAPEDPYGWLLLSGCYAMLGTEKKALRYLEKALKTAGDAIGNLYDAINGNDVLQVLQSTRRYQILMKRYFPDQ